MTRLKVRVNLNSNNSDAISVSYPIPLVLCPICNRKEKVSFFFPSFSFLISFLVHVYVGGGISLLQSVIQKHTYLKNNCLVCSLFGDFICP